MKAETINEEIFALKRKIIDNKYAILKNKMGLQKFERSLMGAIANELGEDKKPKYGNAEKRQAEFDKRVETDKDTIVLREYIEDLERARDEMYAELEFNQNVFQIEVEKLRLGLTEQEVKK